MSTENGGNTVCTQHGSFEFRCHLGYVHGKWFVVSVGLGGVNGPEFENLDVLVIIRSLARLLPIALIPFLIPDGAPSDEAKTAKLEGEGGGGGLAFKDSIAVTDLDDDDDDGVESPVVSVAVLRRASSSSDGGGAGVRPGGSMEMASMEVAL